MKRQLFKVLFMCMAVTFLPQVAHAAGDVEINATNFPDDIFRNYLLQQDYGKDGKLTEDEIKSITYLEIDCLGIRSLKGIEYLTELGLLSCSFNQLTSLDVSKNTVLQYLFCYGNLLTTLDVSKNTALTELHCVDNQLTDLDVSENMALTILDCTNNQLATLDVSRCTALAGLNCYHNQLTELDVSKNTELVMVNCGFNQLTDLDVSGNAILNTLEVDMNRIKWTSMDNLIKSLPINNTDKPSGLYVYNSQFSSEGNVCTKEQIKAAREKGWIAYYWGDFYPDDDHTFKWGWKKYEDSDDTPSDIDGIRTETYKDAPVYNLRGQRLTAPQKGINIIGGRKVIMR